MKVRWGILATGTIAATFAGTLLQMGDEAELVAVASRDEARARDFARRFGIPKAYGSYEALAADPDVDAVYVATPHSRHDEDVRLLIEAGKHVLCEKSFTADAAQAERIFALAKARGVFVMEAFWTKFIPLYAQIEAALASGEIGEVLTVTAQYGYTTAREARKLDPALAGGALLDIGVYAIGFACMVLGYEPDEIVGRLTLGEQGTDIANAVMLRYGRAMALLTSSIGTKMPVFGAIYGTRGRIEVPEFKNPEHAFVYVDGQEPRELSAPLSINGYEYQVREAMDCIRAGKLQSERMTGAQTVAVMRIMDEVRRQGGLRFPFEKQG